MLRVVTWSPLVVYVCICAGLTEYRETRVPWLLRRCCQYARIPTSKFPFVVDAMPVMPSYLFELIKSLFKKNLFFSQMNCNGFMEE